MVPAVYVVLDQFPLTPNGKIDQKALPDPDRERHEKRELAEAQTQEEEILCGIFAEVLELQHVGIEEDFFQLGGHSLLAAHLISKARQVFPDRSADADAVRVSNG